LVTDLTPICLNKGQREGRLSLQRRFGHSSRKYHVGKSVHAKEALLTAAWLSIRAILVELLVRMKKEQDYYST
jgi:hypothetical protein